MDESRREKIFKMSAELVADTPVVFKRYLYSEVDWDSRLVCIKGARGVGKTTMLLQHVAQMPNPETALYRLSPTFGSMHARSIHWPNIILPMAVPIFSLTKLTSWRIGKTS